MSDLLQLLLTIAVGTVGVIFALYVVLQQWAAGAYDRLQASSPSECDIDAFCGSSNPPDKLKVMAVHKLRVGSRQPKTQAIELEAIPSEHVPGLWVSQAKGTSKNNKEAKAVTELIQNKQKSVVVATIRMGFGHHRLAYSACSWALEQGYTTIFHDLINIESEEAKMVGSADTIYSRMSRLASELGGPVEYMWGQAMKQGDPNGLRIAALEATHLMPLLLQYPKDIPLITTHQLCALTAAAAGFTNVINLVVDNYPQWFLVVPKTLNLVQGPVNYQCFLKMGVPPNQIKLAGHWNPFQMVSNIPKDCQHRITRATAKSSPIRLLIPVGGAGAQKFFINSLIEKISHLVKDGKIQLFLNAGDHKHMATAFQEVLGKCSLDYESVTTTKGVYDFQKSLLDDAKKEPNKAVTLFTFEEYFPAVATTDILSRVSDVLVCKPSELAFYALPKLHIRRVGDHEADSARRAGELGDGSLEARELDDAMDYIRLFLESPDLLTSMNEQIIANNKIGVYNGCEKAVQWAIEGKGNPNVN